MVLPRRLTCVCVSASDTRAPVSVSGHLEKESTWCRARVKADENETQNPDLSLRHERVEVWKTCVTGCVTGCLIVYSELDQVLLPITY